ncbi:MAG: menaquinone biosynthesis protein [Phycisphaerales bacterium]|nr:menaquinone biosynthesis protein [Phycisphaerales bacterium]
MSDDQANNITRVGCVSYLNTLPLIDGLDRLANLSLSYSVPSALLGRLLAGEIDLGLISTIDYQLARKPLRLVGAGMIGCDGPTLTVRVYSAVPADQITTVHVDRESHTSVALMRIILREMHGRDVDIIEFDARQRRTEGRGDPQPETMLLIGDKVVTDSPPTGRYSHQLDLGEAWHALTGLPFVYAVWMCRDDLDEKQARQIATAAAVLDRQRRHNVERIDQLLARSAVPRGWPIDLARAYLTDMLRFAVGQRERQAIEVFFDKANQAGLTPRRRPTTWL